MSPRYAVTGTNTDSQGGVHALPQEVLLYLLGATPFGWNLAFFFQFRLVFLLHATVFEQLVVKLLNLQHRQLFQLHAAKLWNDMVINRVMVKRPC